MECRPEHEGVGTMDVWRVDFCSAERLDCSWIDFDICSSDSIQDGAGVVRCVNLRCIAMS